jgi:hypothetical protein
VQQPYQHGSSAELRQAPLVVNNVNVAGGSRSVKISTAEHVMHAILTLCTMGLWLPIWVIRAITASRRIGA